LAANDKTKLIPNDLSRKSCRQGSAALSNNIWPKDQLVHGVPGGEQSRLAAAGGMNSSVYLPVAHYATGQKKSESKAGCKASGDTRGLGICRM
jgi:hypothetical protein